MSNFTEISQLLSDIDKKPETGKPLIVFCYDKTMFSPVLYCGQHFHLNDDSGLKEISIHKWAYLDDFYKCLGIPEIDAEQYASIKEKLKQERKEEVEQSGKAVISILGSILMEIGREKTKQSN